MATPSFRDVIFGTCIVMCFLLAGQRARAQDAAPAFDSAAVEGATTISGGVCSNSAIGISYTLPQEMKAEDAAAMRRFAYRGSANRGIGPEARYFLEGYGERRSLAMLCGAGSKAGLVGLVASPSSLVEAQGPNALEKLVEMVGQEFHAQPSAPRVRTVNGLKLVCADVRTEISTTVQADVDIRATSCAAAVNSYVLTWNLVGYSDAEWKRLNAGMNSVKIFAPQPLKATVANPAPSGLRNAPTDPQFQVRLKAFMEAWLDHRNTRKTMAFFDHRAYSAPPLIGNYCDGWYQSGASPRAAAQIISANLMGVPKQFPKNTQAPAIFTAWKLFPKQWLSVSANDVAKDHYLVVRLDEASLNHIFSGVFSDSKYGKYLREKLSKGKIAYWAVFPERMPDGDLFVIFTLWQQSGGNWKITDMDVICQ